MKDGPAQGRTPPVTMQLVAETAGVSPMTVSNAFRHPARVQEATRHKVLKVAAELGYVPNLAAANLASGRSRVVGAIIPSIKNSSFYRYIRGMREAAEESGHELVLTLTDTPAQEFAAVQTFIGLRVAGITLVGSQHEPATVDLIRKTGIPVVESWVLEDPVDMAVGFSVAAATRSVAELLLASGRRHIGFVGYGGAASQRFNDRLAVFRQHMALAGVANDLVHLANEADGFGAGPRALEALCRQEERLDAVICATDIVAAGILFECGRRGWRVPDRLAVAGWGDYEIAAEITPGLTTVQPHAYEMGWRAVTMILDRAKGASVDRPVVDTGFRLVHRAST